jgi:hypothetical protein
MKAGSCLLSPVSWIRPARRRSGLPSAFALLALLPFSSCICEIGPPPPDEIPVAQISTVVSDGGFDLVLANLERPVRALQVDVQLGGANATAARQLNGADVVEAALSNPKNDFTVVVSDTRRLNLPPGAVVHVDTDASPSSITLTNAFAVDDLGAKRVVEVVSQ